MGMTRRMGTKNGRGRWTARLAGAVVAVVTVGLAAGGALGQEVEAFDLTGTVVGESGQPLVGAFVSFPGADWGSLSDEEGVFRIPDILPGRVELEVEQLGYATLTWAGEVGPTSGPLVLRMEPRAVMLEGLTVVTDRFRSRRNATATSSRAWDRTDLVTSPYESAAQFVSARAGLSTTPCRAAHTSVCVWSRGRAVAPVIYVDEAPVFAGMEYLESMRPHELHLVEVFSRGRHIRVYTEHFMERAARTRLQPMAFIW